MQNTVYSMKIITHGNTVPRQAPQYRGTCPVCNCIFQYTLGDCTSIERSPDGFHTVRCPEILCSTEIRMKNGTILK